MSAHNALYRSTYCSTCLLLNMSFDAPVISRTKARCFFRSLSASCVSLGSNLKGNSTYFNEILPFEQVMLPLHKSQAPAPTTEAKMRLVQVNEIMRLSVMMWIRTAYDFYWLILLECIKWQRGIDRHTKKKLHGLSPRANYTDRATAACRRSDCQLLRIEGATWSAW
jgi:hypothetical protein